LTERGGERRAVATAETERHSSGKDTRRPVEASIKAVVLKCCREERSEADEEWLSMEL
jgi:hypothetical protein